MAIDITPHGDFCVRAAKPENGEGNGTRYEIIGTDRGYTVPKDAPKGLAEQLRKNFLKGLIR